MDKNTIWLVVSSIVFVAGFLGFGASALDNLQSDRTTEIIYGNAMMFDDAGNEIGSIHVPIEEKTVFNMNEPLHWMNGFAVACLLAMFVGFICMACFAALIQAEHLDETSFDKTRGR
jgi:hypothetical protein